MLKLKKPAAVILAAMMLFSMCSCSEGGSSSEAGSTSSQGSGSSYHINWLDSNLFENVEKMGKANLKDDFAAAVNYDWAKDQKEDYTYSPSTFGEAQRKIAENKRAFVNDKNFRNKNVELIRVADGLFNDWEYRNSLGVEPLRKYLGYIDEIKTLDDVTRYMTDNEKNPFSLSLVNFGYMPNEAVEDQYVLNVKKPDLVLGKQSDYVAMTERAYKEKDKKERLIGYLLGRCGCSEMEIKNILASCFRFESKLVHLNYEEMEDWKKVITKQEVFEKAGKYPFKELLEHYRITDCDHYMGEISYLDKIERLYKENNVSDMKAYFKARLAIKSIRYLDREADDFYMDNSLDRTNRFAKRIDSDPDFNFFDMLKNTVLTAAVDQAYLDYYYNDDTYKEVKGFVAQLKEKYKILISESKNLSDASKKAVHEKLDKMKENVIFPSNKADFEGVTLKSKEEGGSFLDAFCVLNRLEKEHVADMVKGKFERGFWDIYDKDLSTTVTNASYDVLVNAIYIRIGILVEPVYSPDAPIEKKLGSFVTVLGHEISHAFDTQNISRDYKGHDTGMVSKDELKIWDTISSRIGDHFYGFTPFEGSGAYETAGSRVSGEVIADAEGVKAAMMIGKDHENFNYDLFFRSFASFWKFFSTKSRQMEQIKSDHHPIEFIRINYTLAQFDEFYETYGIKPGDGMYMDPSQRILIW